MGLPKQRQVKVDCYELPCFRAPLCNLCPSKCGFNPIVPRAYPFLIDVQENVKDPLLPIKHCRLRSLGGHFCDVENCEAFVCRQNRIPKQPRSWKKQNYNRGERSIMANIGSLSIYLSFSVRFCEIETRSNREPNIKGDKSISTSNNDAPKQ